MNMQQYQYMEHQIETYRVISGLLIFTLVWLAAEFLNAYWNRKQKDDEKLN